MKAWNSTRLASCIMAALSIAAIGGIARGQVSELDAAQNQVQQQGAINSLLEQQAGAEVVLSKLLANLERLKSQDGNEELVKIVDAEVRRQKNEIQRLQSKLQAAAERLDDNGSRTGDAATAGDERFKQLIEKYEEQLHAYEALANKVAQAPLPMIESPSTNVYKLKYIQANGVAEALMKLFGTGALRVAIGDDPSQLIVVSGGDLADDVAQLIHSLDVPRDAADERGAGSPANQIVQKGAKSLLVRIFWVADHLPENEGQKLVDFLPIGVIEAFATLGLENPRIVTQTVNSVATQSSDRFISTLNFATSTLVTSPSIASTQLNSQGQAILSEDGHVDLQMKIDLSGGTTCQLEGAISAPLGHYVVLGTANSFVTNPQADAPTGADAGETQGGRGFNGFGGGRGGLDGGMGMAPAGVPFGGQLPANTHPSRLAFVVQVIENKSYAMDGNE